MSPARLLIVDDTPANIQLAAGLLAREGWDIAFAVSGQEALDLVQTEPFDLILLDIMMPGMDGHEVILRLKADPVTKDIPVIFLSAKAEITDITAGFALGAVDYVTKPFNGAELTARVKTHLELRFALRSLAELNQNLEKRVEEEVARRLQMAQEAERLRALASQDGLTGLINRRGFDQRLALTIELCLTTGQNLALLLLDLDHFKKINDTHGHHTGDLALQSTAALLTSQMKGEQFCARFGGEEFVVIYPGVGKTEALEQAETLRAGMETLAPLVPGLKLTFSGGLAQLSEAKTAEELLRQADAALYQAKNAGRNRLVLAGSPTVKT